MTFLEAAMMGPNRGLMANKKALPDRRREECRLRWVRVTCRRSRRSSARSSWTGLAWSGRSFKLQGIQDGGQVVQKSIEAKDWIILPNLEWVVSNSWKKKGVLEAALPTIGLATIIYIEMRLYQGTLALGKPDSFQDWLVVITEKQYLRGLVSRIRPQPCGAMKMARSRKVGVAAKQTTWVGRSRGKSQQLEWTY